MSEIEYFERVTDHKFSHISELYIVFITDLRNMTYDHYIKIPKPMWEWTIIKKLANNPNIIKAFNINSNDPLIRKYSHIINDGKN